MSRPKAVVSWSSGKDSAWALHEVIRAGELDVVGVLTCVTDEYRRVSMHGVRESLLDKQVIELGLPCRKIRIPTPCPNEVYDREMAAALRDCQSHGVTHVVFGDLFLRDIREYREQRLAQLGMTGVFPLWRRDTFELACQMLDAGLEATITCVDPRALDRSFAGRRYDSGLLAELPASVDPCGENGELHTVVTGGPMFRRPIAVEVGEIVERDGFVFADVQLTECRTAGIS